MWIFKRKKIPKHGIVIYTFTGIKISVSAQVHKHLVEELETKSEYQFFQDRVRCIATRV